MWQQHCSCGWLQLAARQPEVQDSRPGRRGCAWQLDGRQPRRGGGRRRGRRRRTYTSPSILWSWPGMCWPATVARRAMVARAARALPAVTMAVTRSPHPAHLPAAAHRQLLAGKPGLPGLNLPSGHCIVCLEAWRGAAADWPPRALLPRPPPPALRPGVSSRGSAGAWPRAWRHHLTTTSSRTSDS